MREGWQLLKLTELSAMIIYGKNPVFEAIKFGKVSRIYIRRGAALYGVTFSVPVEVLSKPAFDERYPREAQGLAALAEDIEIQEFNSFSESALILDKITDPQNFGAMLRSAAAFGVKNILLPRYGSCPVTAAVVKASAGAVYHTNIYETTNLKNACEKLKSSTFTVAALDMEGMPIKDFKAKGNLALIVGSEGCGVRDGLKSAAVALQIPMRGGVGSFNAAHAVSIALYELLSR